MFHGHQGAHNVVVQHIHNGPTNFNSGVDGDTLRYVAALAEKKASAEAGAKAEAAKAVEASAFSVAKDEIIDHISTNHRNTCKQVNQNHRNTCKQVNHVGEAINATVLKSQKKVRKSILYDISILRS